MFDRTRVSDESVLPWMPAAAMALMVACGTDDGANSADLASDTGDTVEGDASPDADPPPADTSDLPAACECAPDSRTCTLIGAATPEVERENRSQDWVSAAESAGALLVECLHDVRLAGFAFEISGYFIVNEPIELKEGASLVGSQALALDDDGVPELDDNGEPDCRQRGEHCWPVLASGATPTVIEGAGLCDASPTDCDVRVITAPTGATVSRLTVLQPPSLEDVASGIEVVGSDVTISEVDSYQNRMGIRVAPCPDEAVVDEGGVLRCSEPTTQRVRIERSVVRYSTVAAIQVRNCGARGCLVETDMGVTLEQNAVFGSTVYGLFFRVFESEDCRLDLSTRSNHIFDNQSMGVSIQTRYGGQRNRIQWMSENDLMERNQFGIEVAGCAIANDPLPCVDNVTRVELRGTVSRDNRFRSLYAFGVDSNGGGQSTDNVALIELSDATLEGTLNCRIADDHGNRATIMGTAESIRAENNISSPIPDNCLEAQMR